MKEFYPMAPPQILAPVPPAFLPAIATTALGASAMGDVRGIILRAVTGARAAGRDYVGQCHAAAAAVMAVRPDLSLREAFDAVTRLRDS
jgi:hypothetical protein